MPETGRAKAKLGITTLTGLITIFEYTMCHAQLDVLNMAINKKLLEKC